MTHTMMEHLLAASKCRPVAGNDDGWLRLADMRTPTIRALVHLGMLETKIKGPCTKGAQYHRLTAKGWEAVRSSGPLEQPVATSGQ